MFRGAGGVEGYEWLSGERSFWGLSDLVKRHFLGRFLLIACFDSGPITPGEEEAQIGWRVVGGGMLSPLLTDHLCLPAAGYDEWWIFDDARTAERFPIYDYFVNYSTWTLRSPVEIESTYDPTWERGQWEWLKPLQKRFWKMVDEYRPSAYVADGGQLSIASRDYPFLDAVARHSDA